MKIFVVLAALISAVCANGLYGGGYAAAPIAAYPSYGYGALPVAK